MNIDLLKKRKQELGLTNQQLSALSGISLNTINKIFNGTTKSPRLDTLTTLASVLGLNPYHYEPDSQPFLLSDNVVAYGTMIDFGPYTIDDYLSTPEDELVELIDGYLIHVGTPSIYHQDIVGEVYYYIKDYLKKKKGPCKVLVAPASVRLENDDRTVLLPDLFILCDPKKSDGTMINGAPDFVAEVLSPSSHKRDCIVKLNKYWKAGVREYWIINPEKKIVTVYLFQGPDKEFDVKIYNFTDKIPVNIFSDLSIDFNEFDSLSPNHNTN